MSNNSLTIASLHDKNITLYLFFSDNALMSPHTYLKVRFNRIYRWSSYYTALPLMRVSLGWWLFRLTVNILAFLRLTVIFFLLRLTKY